MLHRSNGRSDTAYEERRKLSEVQDVDVKLCGMKGVGNGSANGAGSGEGMHGQKQCVTAHSAGLAQQGSGASATADLASMPSWQVDANSPRVSSIVKRVVEATGHGLEQLLGQENCVGPTPMWTTSSLAVRPTSR